MYYNTYFKFKFWKLVKEKNSSKNDLAATYY